MQNLLGVLSKGALNDNSPLSQLVKLGTGGRGDLVEKVLGGTLAQSKEGLRAFAANLKRQAIGFARGNPNDPTETLEKALGRLTPELRGMLSQQFESTYGVGLNELNILLGNINDSTKYFGETMDELNKKSVGALTNQEIQAKLQAKGGIWLDEYNKKLKDANGDVSVALQGLLKMKDLPPELTKILVGQISLQQAKSQQDHLILDTGNNLLAEVSKNIKTKGAGGAFTAATTGSSGRDFRDYLAEIKKQGGGGDLEGVLTDQVNRLNKSAEASGLKNLKIDPKSIKDALAGGDEGIDNLIQVLQRNQDILIQKQAAANNPVRNIELKVDPYGRLS